MCLSAEHSLSSGLVISHNGGLTGSTKPVGFCIQVTAHATKNAVAIDMMELVSSDVVLQKNIGMRNFLFGSIVENINMLPEGVSLPSFSYNIEAEVILQIDEACILENKISIPWAVYQNKHGVVHISSPTTITITPEMKTAARRGNPVDLQLLYKIADSYRISAKQHDAAICKTIVEFVNSGEYRLTLIVNGVSLSSPLIKLQENNKVQPLQDQPKKAHQFVIETIGSR